MEQQERNTGRFGRAVAIGATVLGLTGCAADGGSPFGVLATEDWVRNYVREQIAPVDAKIAQVDSRVTQVDGRVTKVAAQTTDARKVADDGVKSAAAANARITQALADRYKRTQVETVSLRFASGKFAIEPAHKESLDRVLKMLADNPTYSLDIIGFADSVGGKTDNMLLSWRREEHVRRYLVERGAQLDRISFIGLGEELSQGDKSSASARAADRHVSLVVFRPGN